MTGTALQTADVCVRTKQVGIPARILEESGSGGAGFSAYAVSRDMNDPLTQAIHRLATQCAEYERRLAQLSVALKKAGIEPGESPAGAEIDPNSLDRIVD